MDKPARLEEIYAEKTEIHQNISALTAKLGQLSNEAWKLQCDIDNPKNIDTPFVDISPGQ